VNVFKLHREIRRVGHNYGLPVWFVDCGLGVSYSPENLIRKLASMGLTKGNWVVVRKGVNERGVGTLVDALKYVGVQVEVEASGSDKAPGWFPKVDRWVVYWDGSTQFNFGAMRPKRDMLICKSEDLDEMLEQVGQNNQIDKGLVLNGQIDFDKVWKYKVRVYESEKM